MRNNELGIILRSALLSDLAREAGFRWPVAVTQDVWSVLETSEVLKAEGQSYIGRAWDMLTILRASLRSSKGGRAVCFAALFVMEPGKSPRPVSMRAVSGPGDEGEPTITIMKS
ncbi:MAG: hypothetical protein Q7J64_03150 [Elusimicrobiota bacterium]|nr:hypothetical protein [Elusimicrobiota bacterium]